MKYPNLVRCLQSSRCSSCAWGQAAALDSGQTSPTLTRSQGSKAFFLQTLEAGLYVSGDLPLRAFPGQVCLAKLTEHPLWGFSRLA